MAREEDSGEREEGGSIEEREEFFCLRIGGGVIIEEVREVVGSADVRAVALLYNWCRLISLFAWFARGRVWGLRSARIASGEVEVGVEAEEEDLESEREGIFEITGIVGGIVRIGEGLEGRGKVGEEGEEEALGEMRGEACRGDVMVLG